MTTNGFSKKEIWDDGYANGLGERNATINAVIRQVLISYLKRETAPCSSDVHLAKGLFLLLSLCDNGYLDEELKDALDQLLEILPNELAD